MSELPLGWTEAPLLDVVEVHDNRRVPLNSTERAAKQGEFPYYGANGLVDHIDDFIFDGHYVLLAEDGGNFDKPERGVAYEAEGRFWVNNHAHILAPVGGMSPRFLKHWLNSINWMPYVGGSTRLKLTQAGMAQVHAPLPPLPEQQRIVVKVDGLTARTGRARKELDRIPTLIARYKQRLLALAAEGLLTRNWRDENGGRAWTTTTVAGLAETTFDGPFGSNLKSADYVDSGVRVVRLENIGSLRFIREKETYITEAKFKSLQRHELKPDDVLFSSFIAEEIRVCLLPDDLETVAINKADCFCVRVDRNKCLPKFLAYRLASPTCYEALKDAVHGATRPRISLSHLKQFEIELPPLEEQAEIVRRIESAFGWLDRMAADHAAAARLLPKLDAAVLAKAFQGKLVLQDPNDEPAVKLLERVKAEREAAPKEKRGRKSRNTVSSKDLKKMAKNLEQVLAEAGDWISAKDAFQLCGIGGSASTEEIEKIYAELRKLDKSGKLEAEPVNDEQGRKLHDRLRLKAA